MACPRGRLTRPSGAASDIAHDTNSVSSISHDSLRPSSSRTTTLPANWRLETNPDRPVLFWRTRSPGSSSIGLAMGSLMVLFSVRNAPATPIGRLAGAAHKSNGVLGCRAGPATGLGIGKITGLDASHSCVVRFTHRESGGIGRRAGLRIQCRKASGFDSRLSQFAFLTLSPREDRRRLHGVSERQPARRLRFR